MNKIALISVAAFSILGISGCGDNTINKTEKVKTETKTDSDGNQKTTTTTKTEETKELRK